MAENTPEEMHRSANKPNIGAVLSTSLYTVTAIVILAYLYRSFSAFFLGV